MIDAVITYVDGSDKTWLEKYRSKVSKPIEETETRYRSYDCLDLQVRLIRKFMKFVDNIFIVVDSHSQVEKYSFTEEDNVTIVTHEEIIPKRYLPCFNSCAIEMFFYNIKDLKENFVYFNDDVFVVSECTEDDFFVNGKPCISFNEKNIELENNDSIFDHNIANSCNIIKEKFPVKRNRKKYVRPSHSIIPLKKSSYTYIWSKCFNDIDKSLTRTRHRRNYNVYLFTNYEYYVRSYVSKKLPMKFYTVIAETQNIYDDIKNDGLKSICMNDIYIYDFNEWKVEFTKMLSCLLYDNQYVAPVKEESDFVIDDMLIVSFTSWTKRIQYCKHTVDLMMNQTVLPDKIILNLSEEEFPNKMNDLPDDLVEEAINNNIFEIYWVKENTTVWKKIIPTMDRFPNDLVFSIDDDIEYPSNYIEEMYKTYCENDKQYPIVGYEFIIDGNLCHSGPFTLTSKKFYGDLLNDIYNDVILPTLPEKKWQSDIVYYKVANSLGYNYVKCESINCNAIYNNSKINKEDRYSIWNKEYKNERNENIQIIDKYLKNEIKYDDEKLIVSLTSYPARIKYVKDVLFSLINQSVSFSLYHIVLVLAISEFPNKEKDLPIDLVEFINEYNDLIEILWYERNIRSHKKLIPTLKKYPNNPILVCDDDVIRPQGWLRMFLEDHTKYPNDIIFGVSSWYFGDKYKLMRFKQFKCKKSGSINNLASQTFKTAKPANGLGGCLYPVGTFVDERFFDEDLFMRLSPSSDESWQYCFNIMDNRVFRQTSKIIDYSKYFLDGTQEIATSLHKVNNYTEINDRLFKEFPKFKLMLNKRMKEFVVAFTTHGPRVKHMNITLNSLLNQTLKPYKIIITIHKDDVQYIQVETLDLIKNNKCIDLIICDKKLGPHTKYFYAMQKYRNYAVITVDDDHEYDCDLCESLWKSYINNPNLISARRVHLIKRDENGNPLSYNFWRYNCNDIKTSNMDLFATGVGGVLYPPDILKISDKNLTDIYKCLYADDIYLKWLEKKLGIETIWCKNKNTEGNRILNEDITNSALYLENVKAKGETRNDKYLKLFKI